MPEDRPIRALLIAADLSQGGGVNKVIADLANLFVTEYRFGVSILNGTSSKASLYNLNTSVRVIHNTSTRWGALAYFAAICRQRGEAYDVVISFWTQENLMTLVAFFAARRTRVIVCEHACSICAGKLVAFARAMLYRVADRVVVLNRREFDHYGRGANRVRLIHNPVAAPDLDSPPEYERERLVLGVGHLVALKGFADLINAFERAGLAELGWRLALVGEGPLECDLKSLIMRCKSARSIDIVAPTQNIGALYARASLLAVPSKLESFSLVLAEAMAWGVLPIAYSTDGPAEILREFPEHLVRIGDVEELTLRIEAFAKNRHQDIALRRRLRASIVERFAPRVIGEKWAALIRELGCAVPDERACDRPSRVDRP